MQNKGALTQYSLAAREILMLKSDKSLFSADVFSLTSDPLPISADISSLMTDKTSFSADVVSPTGDNLPLSADMFSIMTDTLLLTLPAPGKCTLDIK
jgi:hypothetical protein